MPGHFTLHSIDGKVKDEGEWRDFQRAQTSDDTSFADLVDPVKIVYGVFFDKKGDGDVWVEFTFGHAENTNKPIRIDSFCLGSNNENIDIEIAKTHYQRSGSFSPYIWDEADVVEEMDSQPPDTMSLKDRLGEWRSMYEDYTEVDRQDRVFACNVGDDRILCTPVRYDSPSVVELDTDNDSDLASLWQIQNFRKLSGGTPILYPSDKIGEKASEVSDQIEKDTITFWVKWTDFNLTIPNDDISFHFRFAFHSKIGKVNHSYPYYVLPPRSSLMESLSEQPINEFYPKDTHWMFTEWVKSYRIDRAGTGRMTRSKIKDTDYVFNSGIFGFPTRSPKNMALRFFYAVLGGGILANLVLSSPTMWHQLLSVVGIGVLVFLVYFTFLPRITPIVALVSMLEQYLLDIWDSTVN